MVIFKLHLNTVILYGQPWLTLQWLIDWLIFKPPYSASLGSSVQRLKVELSWKAENDMDNTITLWTWTLNPANITIIA